MKRRRNPAGGARDDAPAFRPAPCGLCADASEHVAEVVVDRVQVLRSRIHGTHLDDESGRDDAVAERPFRRVGQYQAKRTASRSPAWSLCVGLAKAHPGMMAVSFFGIDPGCVKTSWML